MWLRPTLRLVRELTKLVDVRTVGSRALTVQRLRLHPPDDDSHAPARVLPCSCKVSSEPLWASYSARSVTPVASVGFARTDSAMGDTLTPSAVVNPPQ